MTRVLYLDIETAPITAHTWGIWNVNVGLSQIREDPRILCLGAKYRKEKGVDFYSEWNDGREGMLGQAYRLLDEADVVAHFNGDRFDDPWLMGEFARMGWGPPAPFAKLDFLKVIKRRFRFPSYKLDYVSQALGIGKKVPHEGHALWVKCLEGDVAAQRKMERYNIQDVNLLEKLHDRLMPWITLGGNARLMDGDVCPVVGCGGTDLRKEGHRYTATGKYQRFQCRKCGGWSVSGKRVDGTDIRGI